MSPTKNTTPMWVSLTAAGCSDCMGPPVRTGGAHGPGRGAQLFLGGSPDTFSPPPGRARRQWPSFVGRRDLRPFRRAHPKRGGRSGTGRSRTPHALPVRPGWERRQGRGEGAPGGGALVGRWGGGVVGSLEDGE